MQLTDAVKRMRGKPGTKVTISIVREGWTEPKDFDITASRSACSRCKLGRARAGHRVHPAAPVPGADPGDLEAALEKDTKAGMKALILDLRNNPAVC